MNMIKITIDEFAEFKRQQGWTSRKAASEIGICQSHLINILNYRRMPGMEVIEKMFSIVASNQIAINSEHIIKHL
jgi:hypothetical protein